MRGEIKALLFSDGVEVTEAVDAPVGASYFLTDDSGDWDGVEYEKTYDVTQEDDNGNVVGNAKEMIWAFKSGTEDLTGYKITYPSSTQVRVTFGEAFPPDAGTYFLVGR